MQRQKSEALMIDFQQLNKNEIPSVQYSAAASVIAAIYAFTVIAGLPAAFDLDLPYLPVILICCISSAALNFTWNHRNTVYFRLAAVLIPVISAVVLGSMVRNGIALTGNAVLKEAGAAGYKIMMPFSVTCAEAEYSQCIAVTAGIAAVLMVLLCTHLFRDSNCPAALLMLAGLSVINMLYGNTESCIWLAASFICTVAVIIKTFMEEKYIGQSRQLMITKGVLLCMCIMIVTTAIIMTAGSSAEYQIPKVMQRITSGIEKNIDNSRYGNPEKQVMPSGNFESLDDLKFTDTVMLDITADEHESLYLRGFVGGSYTGNGWETVDGNILYGTADVFYWMHKEGMFGQSMIASAAQVLDKKTAEDTVSMSVKVKGADRRYYYTPYEMTGLTADGERVLDETLLEESSISGRGWNGAEYYEITALKNQVKRFPSLVTELEESYDDEQYSQYLMNESHYNAFVYDTYTELSDETEKLLERHLSRYGSNIAEGGRHLNYTQAKAIILDYLNNKIIYSEEIPEQTGSDDFVKGFLESDKTGYSVHYATAAALMFRYYGIPARYVEGYLITPDKVENAKDGSKISITGRDAHAWAEYYQDGIGWIPFETTPVYMDVMEQPETESALGDGGSSGQIAGAGMEMAEDNYESEEPEKDEDERKSLPWGKIFAAIALLLAAVLILALILHLVRRKRRLNELKRSFAMENTNWAVINMYAYILKLQDVLNLEPNMQIYAVYQKAAFSAEWILQEEKQQVADYKDQLLNRIIKECKLRNRFVYRWIKGIY